jgi:hypothetical protein
VYYVTLFGRHSVGLKVLTLMTLPPFIQAFACSHHVTRMTHISHLTGDGGPPDG